MDPECNEIAITSLIAAAKLVIATVDDDVPVRGRVSAAARSLALALGETGVSGPFDVPTPTPIRDALEVVLRAADSAPLR